MLHYLINVCDTALLSASVLGLLYFWADCSRKKKLLSAGLILGAVSALFYVILRRNTALAVREYYDLGAIIFSLLFQLLVLADALRLCRRQSAPKLPKLTALAAFFMPAGLSAHLLPDILLYPLEFDVGMDSIFNQEYLLKALGYLLGLLIIALASLNFYKIAGYLPRRVTARLLAALLLLFIISQILQAGQILVVRGMIPRWSWLVSLVIFMADKGDWFKYALMLLALVMATALSRQIKSEPAGCENPALTRKMKAGQRRQKRYAAILLTCLLACLLTITAGRYYNSLGIELSPPLRLPVSDGLVIIPLGDVNDGHLHRYVYESSDGALVRYIVIRKNENSYGVGLDACDICGPTGYYERNGKEVVCILCDVVMNISTIGFPGGCNPVPLKYSIRDGNLIIDSRDLEAEKRRFQQ